MIAYSYNEKGFLLGQYKCQPNPLEKGEFLLPANATTIEPPEYKKGIEMARFDGEKWEVVNAELKEADLAQVEIKKRPSPKEKKEAALKAMRSARDSLLSASDFALLSDAPESVKQKLPEIIKYRQELRDITKTVTDATKGYSFPKNQLE